MEIEIFDFYGSRWSRRRARLNNYTSLHLTLFCFHFQGPPLVTFALAPASLVSWPQGWIPDDQREIDLGNPEFSKSCLLLGNDETAIKNLFTEEVVEFLKAERRPHIEGAGNCLLLYRLWRLAPPETLRGRVEEASSC